MVRQSNATNSSEPLKIEQTTESAEAFGIHLNCAFTKQLTAIEGTDRIAKLTNYAIRLQHGIRRIYQTETRGKRHSDE